MGVAGRSVVALTVAAIIGVTVAACFVGREDFLMLIDGDVLRATDVSLAVWSLGVLASFGLVGVTVVRHRLHPVGGRGVRAAIGGVLAAALVGTGLWCVGQAVVLNGVAALGVDSYTVLRAPVHEGCSLIVHENGALRTSSGEVFAVGSFGVARNVGSWTADEIGLPVRDGTYALHWNEGVGDLSLYGDHPAMPDRLPVMCR